MKTVEKNVNFEQKIQQMKDKTEEYREKIFKAEDMICSDVVNELWTTYFFLESDLQRKRKDLFTPPFLLNASQTTVLQKMEEDEDNLNQIKRELQLLEEIKAASRQMQLEELMTNFLKKLIAGTLNS